MYIYNYTISFQEIPNEISVCFNFCGCKIGCKDCHSKFLWNEKNGYKLTIEAYKNILSKYSSYISAVCFMGGEWYADIIELIEISNQMGFKTCLYTGGDNVCESISNKLTWLKTGRYVKELGGLDSKLTNQRMTNLKTGECLNYLFQNNI